MVRGEKVDFVPRIPILMHFAADYVRANYGDFCRDWRVKVEANRRLVQDFGFEQLDVMSDPWVEASAFGSEIEYLDDTVPRGSHPLHDAKDLSLLDRPDPLSAPRMLNTVNTVRGYREVAHKQYSITGWVEGPAAEAACLRGVANFLMDTIDDPPFCERLMDLCLDNAVAFASAQVEAGADTIGVGDSVVSQVGPDVYAELILPREKKLFDAIHAAGALVRLHICGDINHLIPLVAQTGVDIIDCDWQVDVVRAREILGGRVTISGNLNPVDGIMKSTPQRIRDQFRALYDAVGNPYFVNAGCEIPRGTPVENLRALCDPIAAR
jgi:MtaA/CmuA family methyltransferase